MQKDMRDTNDCSCKELDKATLEIDRLTSALATADAAADARQVAAVKNARAVAMEEAARRFEAAGFVGCEPGPDGMGIETPAGNIVRALAPLPPTLVVVPREMLESMSIELDELLFSDGHRAECVHEPLGDRCSEDCLTIRRAIATLSALLSENKK